MDITPRNLERVLYFASYLVTDVDIEARDRTIEEIRELSDETIAEIEQEAEERILKIRQDTQAQAENLEEGTGGLVERFELEMQEKLEELKQSYDEISAELKAMGDQPAEKQIKWERKIIVRKNTVVNEEDLTKLNDRYEERQQEIRDEADQLRSGGVRAEPNTIGALAFPEPLGERGPLVRRLGLLAHEGHLALRVSPAERLDGRVSGHATADDQIPSTHDLT